MTRHEYTVTGERPSGITLADLWVFVTECNDENIDPRTKVTVDTFWTSRKLKRIEATR